jgi:phosphatidylglycerophosphate synthase
MTAPIRDAIILAGPDDAGRRIAGVPLLLRTVLVLQSAGVERCTVVGAPAPADPRITCRLATAPSLVPAADLALRLVVGPGTVIDATLVRDLQASARPDTVVELEEGGARVRVAPGPLVAGNCARPMRPGAGTLGSAVAPRAQLERALLLRLENPRDGWLDQFLHRRLSRPVTRLLLPTGITPNAVTMLGIGAGVAGGMLLGVPGPSALVVALALLVVSGVLDCSDGELARLRFATSRLGHVLDVSGDTLIHVAVLAGIAARLARTGSVPGTATLVALGAGIAGAFAAISWSEATEERRRAAGGWENRVLDGVLSPLSTRDWYVFPIAFALAGRLDFMVAGAAVGANVFWVVVAVLVGRVLSRSRA